MKRLTLIAAASVLLIGAAAYAQPAPQSSPQPGSGPRAEQSTSRMERRAARMEERMNRRIEQLKSDLKLTPAQEPLWAPVQAQLRKMQDERRASRQGNMERMRNAELPDRLDFMAQRAATGATNMRELSTAVKPLWATLDASQKETVRKSLPGGRWQGRGDGHGEGRGESRGEGRGGRGGDGRN
jgi:Spy/CpxP family protein refolding chaperone